MDPKHGRYYEVNVSMEIEDDKGRIKKQTVKYLVDAADTTMAEKNTMKLLDGTMYDWEIIGINLSKIREVYDANED
jgi:hypothetical protein